LPDVGKCGANAQCPAHWRVIHAGVPTVLTNRCGMPVLASFAGAGISAPPPLSHSGKAWLLSFSRDQNFSGAFSGGRTIRHKGEGISVPRPSAPGCGVSWIVDNLQTGTRNLTPERRPSVRRAIHLISPESEHPAKIIAPNSNGQNWIRITYIFINDMRTISAQAIDSKQP
jgi:hypothetical protein